MCIRFIVEQNALNEPKPREAEQHHSHYKGIYTLGIVNMRCKFSQFKNSLSLFFIFLHLLQTNNHIDNKMN